MEMISISIYQVPRVCVSCVCDANIESEKINNTHITSHSITLDEIESRSIPLNMNQSQNRNRDLCKINTKNHHFENAYENQFPCCVSYDELKT